MRTTITMSLLAAAALAGCLDAPDAAPPTDPAALAAFEQLGHAAAHRAYPTLSPTQRLVLWRTHLARELDGAALTPAQAAIVAEIEARLPTLVEHYDPALAARAEAVFSTAQLGALFELPGRWQTSVAHIDELEAVDYIVPEPACDTRWCSSCALPPQPPGVHCGGEYCTSTSDGCGWFNQQGCTATCHMDDE